MTLQGEIEINTDRFGDGHFGCHDCSRFGCEVKAQFLFEKSSSIAGGIGYASNNINVGSVHCKDTEIIDVDAKRCGGMPCAESRRDFINISPTLIGGETRTCSYTDEWVDMLMKS